ncbi:MAG: hypothetical protein ACXVQ3_07165 [Gaiellaceae bacterium]
MDRAKRCLACAALEGREFSAPALAHVLERPLDEVIDLLDDVLVVDEARPDGLVVERGLVTIESEGKPPRHVWRYAFVSELHRSALIAYGLAPQERIDLALGYAQALTELYAPSEWLVADALARLFATGGDHRAAEGYRRLAEFTGEVELLRRQARLVLDADTTSWDRAEYAEALHLLLLAGDAMEPSPDAATEGLAVYERACEFADRLGARRDRAFARWGAASCHRSRFESERAIEMFEHAREEFAQLNDPEWETATLIDLANEHAFVGRFERARELLEEASVAARRLRDAESKGLAKLAILERRVELEDDPVEQRRCLKQVLELKRRYRRAGWSIYPTERGLASILMTELDLVGAEMDIDAPDALRDTLLRIEREAGGILGLPGMVMAALLAMARGQLATRNADFVASRSQLADALTLFRAIGNRPGEANAWRALGDLAWQQDRKTAAAIHYATSVFISRTTGSWKANHATQDLLAMRQGEHSADAVERLVDEIGTAYAADGGEALATAVRSDEWPPATKYVRAATHFLGESP